MLGRVEVGRVMWLAELSGWQGKVVDRVKWLVG